ncbi:MAG: hypothetical protein EZS28_025752 [Streblomastix strix]|uniref:Uncharacterized protein n=1 Tax=Streblomastix strix TaxID=222440 RepID=A0A5J4V899_9EUKA|nr:MAG: hypothetical protein EZS28_025752 [Streblomastix strix]
MDYSGKKTEDVLEQLQDENSDLKVKIAFFEKEIKRNDDENAQYRKEIITIKDECRWREQEKLDIQKKKKISVKKKISGQRQNEIEKWEKQQDRGDSTGQGEKFSIMYIIFDIPYFPVIQDPFPHYQLIGIP